MRRLEKLVDAFGALCLGLLLALMVAQVVMRYFFRYTPFFTEEIGRYLLVWSALAGVRRTMASANVLPAPRSCSYFSGWPSVGLWYWNQLSSCSCVIMSVPSM